LNRKSLTGRAALVALLAVGAGLSFPALASAHARISPAVSVAGKLQLYSLAVPTEKSGLTTSTIVMDSLFQFLAQPASAKTYTFEVEQTYSDGSIVNWAGSESSAAPAPTIEVASSLGGGGVSALTIIALVVGVLGLLAGGFALIGGSRERELT
jgi:uncharacterized protein YcnI